MITNADVFHALKTLEVFCDSHYNCSGKCKCPLNNGYDECIIHSMIIQGEITAGAYIPVFWDVESLRPLLDPASATLSD